jgi:hypothetical protein
MTEDPEFLRQEIERHNAKIAVLQEQHQYNRRKTDPGYVSSPPPELIDDMREIELMADPAKIVTEPTPTAPQLLDKAAQLMLERSTQYDKPEGERSMGKAVQAFNAITGRDLSEPEGWLLLQVLKDVRLFQRDGYHADSAEDCIAYAALKAEAKARG